MRDGILNRNPTTRTNKDTRITSAQFREPGLNPKIAIREMGRVADFNDFAWNLSQVGELGREEGTPEAITELKSLMRGHHIERNSSGNLRISGPANDRISKTLTYGKN